MLYNQLSRITILGVPESLVFGTEYLLNLLMVHKICSKSVDGRVLLNINPSIVPFVRSYVTT